MDRQQKAHKSIISTGTTSIVLIFVMLSLLTFSVLSLVSAQANLRLSRKSADRTTDYYQAENAANDIMISLLRDWEAGSEELAQQAPDGQVRYEVPLGEDQVLAVALTLPMDGEPLKIEQWQVMSRYDWSPDDTLNLLGTGPLPDALDMED